MRATSAVQVLTALAHPTRLEVFRQLVREGDQGLTAGELAARLQLPASSLSFHLQDLTQANLLRARREGRTIRYAVRHAALNELLWYLGEDCCQGRTQLCPSPTGRIDARLTEVAPITEVAQSPRVLFLCSHNAARSQLSEALLRQLAPDLLVHSAGLRPRPIHPPTRRVLAEAGVPTDGLRAKDLGELLGKVCFEHVLVVCPTAQEDCAQMAPFARNMHFWPFPDPAAPGPRPRQLEAFRAVRDGLRQRLEAWLAEPATRRSRRRTRHRPLHRTSA